MCCYINILYKHLIYIFAVTIDSKIDTDTQYSFMISIKCITLSIRKLYVTAYSLPNQYEQGWEWEKSFRKSALNVKSVIYVINMS